MSMITLEEIARKRPCAADYFNMILKSFPELKARASFEFNDEYQSASMSIGPLIRDGDHDLSFWDDDDAGPSISFSFWHGHFEVLGSDKELDEEKEFLALLGGILSDRVVAIRDADNPESGWISIRDIGNVEDYFEKTAELCGVLEMEGAKRVRIVSWSGKWDQVVADERGSH